MRSSSPLFLWIVYNLWKMFLISLTTLIENPSGSGPLVACKSMASARCNWLASVQRSAWSAIFWSRLTCSSRYEIPPWELWVSVSITGSIVLGSSSPPSRWFSKVASVVSALLRRFQSTMFARSCTNIWDLCSQERTVCHSMSHKSSRLHKPKTQAINWFICWKRVFHHLLFQCCNSCCLWIQGLINAFTSDVPTV